MTMNKANEEVVEKIALPSDQDISGRTFDQAELNALRQVLESGTLTSTKGQAVKRLEKEFAELCGVEHAFACASGTAAIHCAIAAIDPEPGEEIVTTAITDMGALTPILYQGAIPVFADVDPQTYNITADTIALCLSERTRAIIVTHLFGNPCNMPDIMDLARSRNITVIEDTAQSFLAKSHGRLAGTIGTIGCFSLQQGKHITTGEGGIITTNDDALARRIYLFINKAWGYGDKNPDHYFLALNYRMSELQGAVACAQLKKLKGVVESRQEKAIRLSERLRGLPGIETPKVADHHEHSYWRYCIQVDPEIIRGGVMELGRLLRDKNLFTLPRYIQKPAFMCEVFQKQKTFGKSRYPFSLARPEALDYRSEKFPGTYKALDRVLVIPWNERMTIEHVYYIAESIQETAAALTRGR
jgi:perosamine synthetase